MNKCNPVQNIPPRNVAVIDVGSSAIRMEIAEILVDGGIRTLDELSHATNLGRDVFTGGSISQETIEECINVLSGYKTVISELGINAEHDVWAVGTSAVREAQNRETFIDRVFSAVGIQIEALATAEIHRMNYNMLHAEIDMNPRLSKRNVIILEVGGGLTEILMISKGRAIYANTYALGVLRVQQELESVHATSESVEAILSQHLKQIEEGFISSGIRVPKNPALVAISGDARFAAKLLNAKTAKGEFRVINGKILNRFVQDIIRKPVEDVAKQYQLPVIQAESLGPALLCYSRIAAFFQSREIHVTHLNFRHGMLLELANNREWTPDFEQQVLFSAGKLGEKFAFDRRHAECVAEIAVKLFRAMADIHRMGRKQEMILRISAILHDIGFFISNRSHHKHSYYLIQNSELFGLPDKERQLIALTARYHRRAQPRSTHVEYQFLERTDRLIVNKLASLLRVADALDRNHLQQARDLQFDIRNGQLRIIVYGIEDPTTERIALKQKGQMFEDVYGLRIRLLKGSKVKGI